jgi:hypothetical protein
MTTVLQQTLFMLIDELTPCIEKDAEGDESYVQTNFDMMVTDYCNEITETGYVILGKTLSVGEKYIFAIIQYMEKPDDKKIEAVKGILTQNM